MKAKITMTADARAKMIAAMRRILSMLNKVAAASATWPPFQVGGVSALRV
jgi:hypothetical protein